MSDKCRLNAFELDQERRIIKRFNTEPARTWSIIELRNDVAKECPQYSLHEIEVSMFRLIGKQMLCINEQMKVAIGEKYDDSKHQ